MNNWQAPAYEDKEHDVSDEERPKIADVALAAGVSVPTVSKVLNGRAHVAAATRERVNEALRNLGYTKTEPAQQQGPGIIQLVFNNFDSPWALQIMDGAEAAAHRLGLTLSCVRTKHVGPDVWRRQRVASQLSGVILLTPHRGSPLVNSLFQLNIPAVVIDPQGGDQLPVPTVSATNFSGSLKAVQHLIELGHQRIAIITGGGALSAYSTARYAAYAAALMEAGLPLESGLVKDGDFSMEAGHRLGGELLDQPNRPTAVFAGNDLQALGLISAAASRGIRIPEELSVVGFDDIALAQLSSPALTTVRQPLGQMAGMAVSLLAEQIKGHANGPQALELATELIERDSTAPLPR